MFVESTASMATRSEWARSFGFKGPTSAEVVARYVINLGMIIEYRLVGLMSRRDRRQAMIRVKTFASIFARLRPRDRLGLAVKIPYTAVLLPSDHATFITATCTHVNCG
ncbi:uncharacterized protein EAE97_003143 [Botrytis byssoidea]|uniref:Uncharacterized protein n=1 Tax=Botrytis byssoidea TaxID=139641 RepID=A0A9P5IW75_9HELO|nr:uncharacterized protein EAE97_003143 [Botrytis byssoidea]KAF7949634.1 hypothetical protein EAE97_003143 [Botrytis byssoidea]